MPRRWVSCFGLYGEPRGGGAANEITRGKGIFTDRPDLMLALQDLGKHPRGFFCSICSLDWEDVSTKTRVVWATMRTPERWPSG